MVKRAADIRIKRVYDPPDDADGTRVLVDRLWPRGLRKENAALTLWLKEIAPSSGLAQMVRARSGPLDGVQPTLPRRAELVTMKPSRGSRIRRSTVP